MYGDRDTREYAAASKLSDLIAAQWPDTVTDHTHDVRILANVNIFGQKIQNLDILLLASFGEGVPFTPTRPADQAQVQAGMAPTVIVRSLCLVIEVKDHQPNNIEFRGMDAWVRYRTEWKSASLQSYEQLWSLVPYLNDSFKKQGIRVPWVTPLLWLRNFPNDRLPPRPHPIIASPLAWEDLLSVVVQVNQKISTRGVDDPYPSMPQRVGDLFTQLGAPPRPDSQAMDWPPDSAGRAPPRLDSQPTDRPPNSSKSQPRRSVLAVLVALIAILAVALAVAALTERPQPPATARPPAATAPTPSSGGFDVSPYIGKGNVANCGAFASQANAQAVLRADSV